MTLLGHLVQLALLIFAIVMLALLAPDWRAEWDRRDEPLPWEDEPPPEDL